MFTSGCITSRVTLVTVGQLTRRHKAEQLDCHKRQRERASARCGLQIAAFTLVQSFMSAYYTSQSPAGRPSLSPALLEFSSC